MEENNFKSLIEQEISKAEEERKLKLGWKADLVLDKNGKIEPTPDNVKLIFNNDPEYKGKFKYNEYLRRCEFDGEEMNDFIDAKIRNDFRNRFRNNNVGFVMDCVSDMFNENRYNPVKDYLLSLEWDGKKRLERLFIDLLEADDNELIKEMTRKWFIGAVKRTLVPGCKFDNMIVLQGGQGIGKSTICERLSKGFFNTISLGEIGNKDIIDKLNKTWIAVIDELDTFNKREMSTIKTFLSQSKDSARLAYAHNTATFDRHCIFIGSTNDETFLRDITSSVERRFWIIKCNKTKRDGKIIEVMTPEYVNQLWAEAVTYYNSDPDQYIDISAESMEMFAQEQEQFKVHNEDNFIDALKMVLDGEYAINPEGEVMYAEQMKVEYSEPKPKYKINKISAVALRKYMKDEFRDERSNKYIANALSEWDYRVAKINGKSIKSFVRVTTIKSTKKEYNPMDEFLVGLEID